jgi:para-aminobenzoate synthetase component 1
MNVARFPYPHSRRDLWNRAVQWTRQFDHVVITDPCDIPFPSGGFPQMIMAGRQDGTVTGGFDQLKSHRDSFEGWLAGYFSYDLKNQLEALSSANKAFIPTPDLCFFAPSHVLIFHESVLEIHSDQGDIFDQVNQQSSKRPSEKYTQARLVEIPDRDTYLHNVNKIREHILEGDMYELNYCMEFGLSQVKMDPLAVYQLLTERSPTPFSVYLQLGELCIISASPERFLSKSGDTLLSQPIKGTARRFSDPVEDLHSKEALFSSEKERAENLMIVDLVRNDIARSAEIGSVQVPELFGIYSFEQWHQMISSVTGKLCEDTNPVDAIANAFPMGSMTGAPKVKVMQLIEQYEDFRRGVYSGAIGYFSPTNDFDFNVVIRSLVYDRSKENLSFAVGSAITYDSDPEAEYDECLLKAKAIIEVLTETNIAPVELSKLT